MIATLNWWRAVFFNSLFWYSSHFIFCRQSVKKVKMWFNYIQSVEDEGDAGGIRSNSLSYISPAEKHLNSSDDFVQEKSDIRCEECVGMNIWQFGFVFWRMFGFLQGGTRSYSAATSSNTTYTQLHFPDFRINKSKKLFVRFYSNDAKNSNVKHSHGVLGPKV